MSTLNHHPFFSIKDTKHFSTSLSTYILKLNEVLLNKLFINIIFFFLTNINHYKCTPLNFQFPNLIIIRIMDRYQNILYKCIILSGLHSWTIFYFLKKQKEVRRRNKFKMLMRRRNSVENVKYFYFRIPESEHIVYDYQWQNEHSLWKALCFSTFWDLGVDGCSTWKWKNLSCSNN